MKYLPLVFFSLLCGACSSAENVALTTVQTSLVGIPVKPNYDDTTMWTVINNDTNDTGADVFYIPSTWEFDYTRNDTVFHHADPVGTPTHRERMSIEIDKVADYMGPGNNFYSPYYRHITLDSWATQNEDTISNRYNNVAKRDIEAAFDHFISHTDTDRPIVLAGFSQGGKAVVELLKILSPEVRQRLVAAYVLGYKVTPDDMAICPEIKAAQDSIDVGVTICYNTVKDTKYIAPVVSSPCAFCINPVNWHTDPTPATFLHHVAATESEPARTDTITVSVDTEHHVLVATGYPATEYSPILDFLNVGDIHSCEPWLYSDFLRHNIALRTRKYREQK